MTNSGVPCMVMRGGTSKGAYFLAGDLPSDPPERDELLRRIMGSPDPRQIDGIGGAHPLTSKVAVVAPSSDGQADIDYLFLQVGVDDPVVTDRQNCGNLLAGVGPFAVERGLVARADGPVEVRVRMVNTASMATARFEVGHGLPVYDGDTAISGVPGTAAPIRLEFEGLAGGSCGSLLPTGNQVDDVAGVACTLIDNGMPTVVLLADDVDTTGRETCAELEANRALTRRLEEIRLKAGPMMGLGDVSETTVPKMTMVAEPAHGGAISTRTFIPHRCHEAIGVLGAVSVATAALLPTSPAHRVLAAEGLGDSVVIEHPTGTFEAVVSMRPGAHPPQVERAGIVRTARKLMDGLVFPRHG